MGYKFVDKIINHNRLRQIIHLRNKLRG